MVAPGLCYGPGQAFTQQCQGEKVMGWVLLVTSLDGDLPGPQRQSDCVPTGGELWWALRDLVQRRHFILEGHKAQARDRWLLAHAKWRMWN